MEPVAVKTEKIFNDKTDIMKRCVPAFTLVIFFACTSQNKSSAPAGDSAAVVNTVTSAASSPANSAEKTDVSNWSDTLAGASGVDSVFNILARQKILKGEFDDVTLITTWFMDATNRNDIRNLVAVVVHTGEGEGATVYSVLAVFEQQEDQLTLVDYLDLGEVTNYGLQQNSTEAEPIRLGERQYGALIHNKSSEEGAGDSGYRKDFGQVYLLLDNKLTLVFETDLYDFHFASNESDSYYEETTTTKLSVLMEMTNGLFNLETTATTSTTVIDESEEAQGVTEEEENSGAEQPEDDGITTYQWNGAEYEKIEE